MSKFLRVNRLCAMLVASGLISLAATSCGGGGGKDNPTPTPTPTTETLSVSPSTLTLAGGASGTINITSNVAWTVSATNGYTVSPASGSNNGTVKVTAPASATGGTVTVKGKGKSASVTISAPSAAAITISPESVSIPAPAGNGQFGITCSGAWSITLPSPKPAWLTSVSPMSGTGNATVTINTANYTEKTKAQTFLTIKSGTNTKYITITKEAAKNNPPTKPTNLKPTGSGVETITTFSWNASTDPDPADKIKYTVMLSKDNTNWTSFEATEKTSIMNKTELDKSTTYYYKVVADDGYDGGKVESDVVTFTTISTKTYWADGECKLYEVDSDGTPTEVSSTSRPFKLIYTGDGYTQDLFNYGGQFDQEVQKGIKALFQIEPYKHYYSYFAIYVIAAYSNEAGMSQGSTGSNPGSTSWDEAAVKVDTKFKCTWAGGGSTGISCNTQTVLEYAGKVPGMTSMAAITCSPISIVINADQYAGTCGWYYQKDWGGWKVLSIAMTPARHPASSSYGGFEYTLRHEYGGHGIGLLGDEYVYYNTSAYPQANEERFRIWQDEAGAYSNIYLPNWDSANGSWYSASDSDHCSIGLTHSVEGANWKTFADKSKYEGCNISLHKGALMYGVGIYRSENNSCMINNVTHYNTISRWQIYCRIKKMAGETPTVEDFMANDTDVINPYASAAPSTKGATPPSRRCEGPLLSDPYHKNPYFLK
ncbi:MAG: hypothetical protein IK041_06370 [Bacteroidales bacterium]|nr:hypothetical protein [Bacteroidales bacterium]